MTENGRVALVTGAARGMGLAIARRLLADGYRVTVIDINPRALGALAPMVEEHGGRLHAESASVTDGEAVRAVVEGMVGRWGKLDVLVNNAGLARPGDLLTMTESDWDDVLSVNLKGAFLCSRAAAPAMRNGGAIVSIGSVAGAGFGDGSPAYSASKAGLVGLTKSMAHTLGPQGIRVNLVAPGVTMTEWVSRNISEERRTQFEQESPLRRLGQPEDVAATVAFLASEDARHITGQVISVSGGQWMP